MTSPTCPKIAVLGAGSIGCYVGGLWQASGLPVTLIGRERIRADIRKFGMTLTDYLGGDIHTPATDVAFETDPALLANADIILICVKSNATEESARIIQETCQSPKVIISLQNGISNADRLKVLLPEHRILAGMVPFNVAYLGDGHWHKGTSGALHIEEADEVKPLAHLLETSSEAILLKDNMPSIMWGKLLLNLNNPLNALSGQTLLAQLSDRKYRRVLAHCIRETMTVLAAANVTPAKVGPMPPKMLAPFVSLPDFFFNNIGLRLQKIDAKARSSMCDDLDLGRRTEIDFLNGEVVRLAHAQSLEAPINSRIIDLIKAAEKGGRRDWTGGELLAHVTKPA